MDVNQNYRIYDNKAVHFSLTIPISKINVNLQSILGLFYTYKHNHSACDDDGDECQVYLLVKFGIDAIRTLNPR